ncbi:hypothetical protein [Pelolinea submarina]|uniref:GDSL-like lipase/acylhydrolase family protein n=1 Tax=Pelolinea submarina TaxID=913107 RepID=A0A3E0A468_9CHLR|nr:hypothetical protein [Pelolinea submarina]REG05359.1 hypothetical protein DFR64_2759 [Pelolinea submarina]
MKSKFLPTIILVLVFSACTVAEPATTFATPLSEDVQSQPYLHATQTAAVEETQAAEDDSAQATPTSETSLPPEDWMEWPVVPEVTDTAREIYRKGLAMGNNTHAFSKVGDCQNVRQSFLGFFDHPGKYEGMSGIGDMQDTINNFKGYFDRDGQATQYGFNAAAVLSPLWADPDVCLPDENPLECELRITRPTFVLISLEFWFAGRTPEVYERYMRQIIEYTMAQGAVPILATKADNVEKDYSLNLTTAKLAAEYDLPLWNWWAAAQPLGDHGIDPYRDGFHISVAAWNVRSKTFLQTLDHLWKGLKDMQ